MLKCFSKGITNGVIPMGGAVVKDEIYETMLDEADNPIELFHGYTYSGHPIAAAAGLATLDIYKEEELFKRASELAPYMESAAHSLKDANHVIDIRNIGLVGAIELETIPGEPTKRAMNAMVKAFEKGLLIRTTGDIIALSPPLIIEKSEIDQIFETVSGVLKDLD